MFPFLLTTTLLCCDDLGKIQKKLGVENTSESSQNQTREEIANNQAIEEIAGNRIEESLYWDRSVMMNVPQEAIDVALSSLEKFKTNNKQPLRSLLLVNDEEIEKLTLGIPYEVMKLEKSIST